MKMRAKDLLLAIHILLLLTEFSKTEGDLNLALHKSTRQSGTQNLIFVASKAVNGIIDQQVQDFTHTVTGWSETWWSVNLGAEYSIGRIELYNRPGSDGGGPFYDRLAKISIYTSTSTSFYNNPYNSSSEWSNKNYHEAPYGPVGIIRFDQQIRARHVAVLSNNTEPLSLVEVEIYQSVSLNKPMNLQLHSNSTDCVILTWQEPVGLTGRVLRYEYKCTGSYWAAVPGSTYTVSRCAYAAANTHVTCSVSAVVVGDASQEESTSIFTSCKEPDSPVIRQFTSNKSVHEGRVHWKYTVKWTPPSIVNCNGTLTYQYGINGTLDSAEISNTSTTFYLDGYQLYNFTLVARNSFGDSNTVYRDGRSNQTVSHFGLSIVKVVPTSSNCVELSWEPPQYPGGPSISYEGVCNDEGVWKTMNGSNNTKEFCGYSPYTEVTCSIRAWNAAGVSQNETASNYTLCADPDSPTIEHWSSEEVSYQNRTSWKYTVVWTPPDHVNCNGTLTYHYGLNGTLDSTDTPNTTFYLDGYQLYNFTLVAGNLHGNSNLTAKSGHSNQIAPQFISSDVELTSYSSSCIKLDWKPPQFPGGPVSHYQYNCTWKSGVNTTNALNATEYTESICGYDPYTPVTCEVKAKNDDDYGSIIKTNTVYTWCEAPNAPGITLTNVHEMNEGRMRWKYTAIWTTPSRRNCNDTLTYQFGINGTLDSEETSNTSATFYLDGYQLYNFTLVARNSHEDSDQIYSYNRSAEIVPQFIPGTVKISPHSSSCIQLSWEPVEYPGGVNITYEAVCNDSSWVSITGHNNTEEFCGYLPYTKVTCSIRARNGAGVSQNETTSNYTLCTDPDPPIISNWSINSVEQNNRTSWMYTVTWLAPSKVNCNDTLTYQYGINGTLDSAEISNTSATFYLDGYQLYNFTLVARIPHGYSNQIYSSNRSAEIVPQYTPGNFTIAPNSSSCIQLSWEPVEYPGGVNISYEAVCNDSTWVSITGQNNTEEFCGYLPYTEVTCSIRARNAAGVSQNETTSAYTLCTDPDPPIISNWSINSVEHNNRTSWMYTVTWLASSRVNCYGTLTYQYGTNGTLDSAEISNTSATFYLDGYQLYNFTLVARNSHGDSNQIYSSNRSAEIVPQFIPRNVKISPNSSSCIQLSWEPVEYPGGLNISYEAVCNDSTWDSITEHNKTEEFCGYSPYAEVTCSIRARNAAGVSQNETTSAYTLCADPDPPIISNWSINSVEHHNRTSWMYIVTWLAPSSVACNGTLTYQYGINGTLDSAEISDTSATFYLDGYQLYNFTLVARNSFGDSNQIYSNNRSAEIVPQYKPENVKISPNSSSCIQLSWEPLEYPGGLNISYEAVCNDSTWVSITGHNNTEEFCGYSPYTEVTCSIRARNAAGVSQNETTSNYTLCTDPDPPIISNWSINSVEYNNRTSWMYTVTWLAPSRVNCNGTLTYQYGINGTLDSAEISNTSATFYLDGYQLYNFTLVARNSHGDSNQIYSNNRSAEIVPQYKPGNFTITPNSSSCVQLSWEPVEYPGGVNISYEAVCNDSTWVSITGHNNTDEFCGYLPYTEVTCSIRARNDAGVSQNETTSNYTLCTDPDPPIISNWSINSVEHNNRTSWMYTVTWLTPSRVNCNGTLTYQYGINGTPDSADISNTSATFYLDGYQLYNFTLVARNSHGDSNQIYSNNTSAEIVPQYKPGNFTITPNSSSCIQLSWEPVEYPGGVNISYEAVCNDSTWVSITGHNKTEEFCGYSPYAEVTCSIRARNDAGVSQNETTSNYTLCADPDPPIISNWSINSVEYNSRTSWMYTVTWLAPSRRNCYGTLTYQYGINGTLDSAETSNTSATFYLDGYQLYNFTLVARNSHGDSTQIYSNNRSAEIVPQFKPGNFTITPNSSSCIQLSWEPVEYPGGVNISYEAVCNDSTWVSITGHNNTEEFCGYSPYTEVTCSIRAKNDAGVSQNETTSTYTLCADPDPPIISNWFINIVEHNNRTSWMYTVTWLPPSTVDCNGTLTYRYGINGTLDSAEISNASATFYLDGYQLYNFTLVARNSYGDSYQVYSSNRSAQIAPQFTPRNVQITPQSSSCVLLSWEPPEYPGGPNISYEAVCNNSTWDSITGHNNTEEFCGYLPYAEVTCSIRAGNAAGVSQNETASGYTLCAEPEPPSIRLWYIRSYEHRNRTSWQYIVVWLPPSRVNCNGTLTYQYGINGTLDSAETSDGHATFYLDGYQLYNFTLVARNSHGDSNQIYINNRSAEIAPQFKPRDVHITSASSGCVLLSWEPPEYPGGPNISYEAVCNDSTWDSITGHNNTEEFCGYLPYTEVTCSIRARNDEGVSQNETVSSYTLCTVPDPPTIADWSITSVEHNNRTSWQYTVTWMPPSSVACNGTLTYQYGINGTPDSAETSNTSATFYLDGYQLYNFTLVARNSHGDSNEVHSNNRSAEIAPQFHPRNVQITSESSGCVLLSWEPPEYPGGPNISYEAVCTNSTWVSITGQNKTEEFCGYSPYTEVTCSIRARNGAGVSQNGTTSGYTPCAEPHSPLFYDWSISQVNHQNRTSWEYTVTWMPPSIVNCNDTLTYQYGINGTLDSAEISNTSATFYLDGYQLFNFTLVARNSHGDSNQVYSYNRSAEIGPQFRSRNVKVSPQSSSCVQLSWEPPEYPGGPNISYEAACNGSTWDSIPGHNNTEEFCGYSPYTEVTCSIRAMNDAGVSQNETASGYTLCADPVFIDGIVYSEDFVSRTNSRMINVSSTQNITTDCESLQLLEASIDQGSFSTTLIFYNLSALTGYNISLKVSNNAGFSAVTSQIIQTGELAPFDAPAIDKHFSTNHSCVHLNWSEPVRSNGNITHFKYKCNALSEHSNYSTDILSWNATDSSSLSICEFEAGDFVSCGVTAFTSVGHGPVGRVQVEVHCDNPTIPEFKLTSFSVKIKEDETVTIAVNMNESQPLCREITRYEVNVTEINNPLLSKSYTYGSADVFNLTNFKAYTGYLVTIVAVNDGNLTSETSQTIETIETAPGTAPNSAYIEPNTTCVILTATKPSIPNGYISSYTVNCTDSETFKTTVTNSSEEESGTVELCDFSSATQITCTVIALNEAGPSPPKTVSKYTKIKVVNEASSRPTVQKLEAGSLSVPVKLLRPEIENTKVSSYLVMLKPTKKETKSKRSIRDCDENFVKNSLNNISIEASECYISAELTSDEVGDERVFDIGDDQTYGGYHNKRLESGVEYDFYLAISVKVEGSDVPLVSVYKPLTIKGPVQVTTTPKTVGLIVGGSIGGVAAVSMVIIALLLFKRWNRTKDKKSEIDTELVPTNSVQFVGQEDPPVNAFHNFAAQLPQAEKIRIRELETYIRSNGEVIRQQYEDLKRLPKPIMETALLPENKGKCRYKGLYPSDEHRVILHRNGTGNDFINASYIAGYSKDKVYLAAQGPTEIIVNDFWYMIWQERPSAIVMVTRAIENGKPKCEQYWPLTKQQVMTFGDISVSLAAVEYFADFTVTRLNISKEGQTRIISHFNYLSWPDHGVPDDLGSYVAFYSKITSITHRSTNPILIHCSAGVGRTGTYIALEYLLEQAKKEKAVDLFSCVKLMRERRPCMVQTEDQYLFLHDVLWESIATEHFKCSPLGLDAKFKAHKQKTASDGHSDRILEEYQHIERRMQSMNFSFTIAQEPDNLDKNRFSDILPCNKYMPFLTNAQGTYINAVFVDAYNTKNQWIVTQLPLSNTISDFWQLIIEQDVNIIVQLESAELPFYPTKDLASQSTSLHSLVRGNAEETDCIRTIPLKVQTAKVEKSVYILALKSWCSASGTFPPTDIILSLCGAVEELQKRIESTKICVTCLDGSSRCGLYICASNAIEKLKSEQDVNLYNPTMMSKIRRPQFISSIDQYTFLYKVLNDYTDSFADYGSLK